MRTVKGLVLAAWIGLAGWGVAQADEYITLASTTSTEQSGLFAHLIPKFKAETGIHVRVIAVGTGQAFTIARRGDADALLVHDPAGEAALVEQGYATERQEVMYNDFVIIGPADDPADVRNATTLRPPSSASPTAVPPSPPGATTVAPTGRNSACGSRRVSPLPGAGTESWAVAWAPP